MRWFGPTDPVALRDIRQAGATEVVTALHEVANGAVWTREAITARRRMIEAAGLGWTVVESLPVHEDIKTRGADWEPLVARYRDSLANLAACGITTVTYNFMPVLDWTRTDLAWAMPDGALALRFELEAAAVFDIHMLRRPGAEGDYASDMVERAARRFHAMDAERSLRLFRENDLATRPEPVRAPQGLDLPSNRLTLPAGGLRRRGEKNLWYVGG